MGKFGKDNGPGMCRNCGQPSQEIYGVIIEDNLDITQHPDHEALPYGFIKNLQWYLILLFEKKGSFNVLNPQAGILPKKAIEDRHQIMVHPEGLTVRFVPSKDEVETGVMIKETSRYEMKDTADAQASLEIGGESKQTYYKPQLIWQNHMGIEFAYNAGLNELWVIK